MYNCIYIYLYIADIALGKERKAGEQHIQGLFHIWKAPIVSYNKCPELFLCRKVPAELICLPPSAWGSDSNPSVMSHLPDLFPLPTLPTLVTSFHLISSPTFAADSGRQPFCLGRLAGWVWWLLAVVCTRCINKVGKKTSDIFSFSLLCGTRNCNMWKGNTVTGINIPFFSSSFFTFFPFPRWSLHSLVLFMLHK